MEVQGKGTGLPAGSLLVYQLHKMRIPRLVVARHPSYAEGGMHAIDGSCVIEVSEKRCFPAHGASLRELREALGIDLLSRPSLWFLDRKPEDGGASGRYPDGVGDVGYEVTRKEWEAIALLSYAKSRNAQGQCAAVGGEAHV